MNVQDVTDRVRRIFGDDSGVQITDSDLIRWVNDAQLKIAQDHEELMEAVGTADIIQNQAEYTLPPDLNTLRSLMYDNFRLKVLSFAEFNEYIDGFKVPASQSVYGTGRPEVFMVYGGTVTLFPTPNANITSGLRIYYSKLPTAVTTFADSLSVPQRYHLSVVDLCLKMAYEMDENPDMMALKKNEFDTDMQKLRNQEKDGATEYYPRITTLPEDDAFIEGMY